MPCPVCWLPGSVSDSRHAQARFPAGHPATLSDDAREALNTVAALSAGVRHGQPVIVAECWLADTDAARSSISPDSTAAACFCMEMDSELCDLHVLCRTDTEDGIFVPCCPEGEEPTCQSQPTAQGWSPSGTYFGLLGVLDAERGLEACVYSMHERMWLNPLSARCGSLLAQADPAHAVTFCDAKECLAAAVGWAPDAEPSAGVLVFGVHEPTRVKVAPCEEVCGIRWLPGTTSLLVVGSSALARLDVDADTLNSTGRLELVWIEAPVVVGIWPACLDLCPGSDSVLILQSSGWDSVQQVTVTLTTFDPAALAPVASRSYRVLPPLAQGAGIQAMRGSHTSLHCSWFAVAVSLDARGVEVFQLNEGRPGKRLFRNKWLSSPSWSACGAFLAGIMDGQDVAVLDGATGTALALVTRAFLWTEYAIEEVQALSVAWDRSYGDMLLVKTEGDSGAGDEQQQGLSSVRLAVVSFVVGGVLPACESDSEDQDEE